MKRPEQIDTLALMCGADGISESKNFFINSNSDLKEPVLLWVMGTSYINLLLIILHF